MNRIKQSELEFMINKLNKQTNGGYVLSRAYGGYRLDQQDGAGYRTISCDGYGTKRQLYTFLRGMLTREVLS